MSQKQRSEESLQNEYTEVINNMRHYSNLRFVIFTVFFPIMWGIISLAYFDAQQLTPIAAQAAKVFAIVVTIAFWIYEERVNVVSDHFVKTAVQLEDSLGYSQISSRPPGKWPIFGANTMTRAFFLSWSVILIYLTIAAW